MNNEQMQPLLDSWFRDREVAPKDVREGVARVMVDVPRTRQQGRWLPFPLLHRRSQTPTATATDTAEIQPSSITATNGRVPTVIGRTRTMFSPARAVVAGALVFAIGGAFLIAQPFDQQAEVAPGVDIGDYAAPVKFTAVITPAQRIIHPTCEVIRGMTQCTGEVLSADITEVSDPRLGGVMTVSVNQNQWSFQPWLEMATYRISNDGGTWQGSLPAMREVGGIGSASVVLVGEGDYGGLYAWIDVSDSSAITGVIFSAPPPEVPAPPPAGS